MYLEFPYAHNLSHVVLAMPIALRQIQFLNGARVRPCRRILMRRFIGAVEPVAFVFIGPCEEFFDFTL